MNGSKTFLFFFLSIAFVTVKGQKQLFNNIVLSQLDQGSGLSETSNAFFFEDGKNNFWISSTDGLNKFDGNLTTVFRPKFDSKGKRFSYIVSSKVFMGSDMTYWFSTSDGLHRISTNLKNISSWHLVNPMTKEPLKEVQLINLDNQGLLWVKSGHGIYTIKSNDVGHSIEHAGVFPENSQRYTLSKTKTYPFFKIITSSFKKDTFHIIEINRKNKINKISPLKIGNNNQTIFNIALEGDSIAWVVCAKGLYQYNLKTFKLRNSRPYSPHFKVDKDIMFIDVITYDDRYLWLISYTHGLFLFDKKNLQRPFVKHYTNAILNGQKINLTRLDKIYAGHDGTIWLANWEKGLFYFNPRLIKFNSILFEKIAHESSRVAVSSIVVNNQRRVFFSVPSHGLYEATNFNNDWKIELIANQIPYCKKVIQWNANKLLCADAQAVYIYGVNDQTLTKIYSVPKIEGNLKDICLLNEKFLIVRSDKKLSTIDLNSHEKVSNPFPKVANLNTVFSVEKDLLFFNFVTDSLLIVRAKKNGHEILEQLAGLGRINHIAPSRNKKIFWLASSQGLIKLDLQSSITRITYLGEDYPLLQQGFNIVLEDYKGNLWVASNAGILQIIFDDSKLFINRFTGNDGVMDYQFTSGERTRFGDVLFFGGPKGIHTVNSPKVKLNRQTPRICLQEIIANGATLTREANLCGLKFYTFNATQRDLTFKFTSSDFVGLKENMFQYKLNKTNFSYDNENWTNMGPSGVINLAGLSKGHYTLKVIVSNSDGIWLDKKKSKRFTFFIKPYWYETIWFYIFLFLLFGFITYLIYRNRLRRIQQKATLIETELKVLRLQMNPHFIYNCLSAIQSYVVRQNVDKANGLIVSFSKLMRKVLTESVKPYLSLSEEKELLESYLRTESLRFENKFNFQVDIDPTLDADEVFIPTMILQPFVENAIVHGFAKDVNSSQINISFKPKGNMLECIVRDNGAGLGNSPGNEKHQSKALEITQKRLQLISKSASMQLVNLAAQSPDDHGVMVILLLPLDLKPD